jgi:uncharacterized membrane protein
MNEQAVRIATLLPWSLRPYGRLCLSAAAGVIAAWMAAPLPSETRIILGLDVFLVSYVVLTFLMMTVATKDQCAVVAIQQAPMRHTGAIASMVATLIGIAAIGVMLHSQKGEAHWLTDLHLGGSLLALFLGWLAAQMTFAIQYMRIYYRALATQSGAHAEAGLDFPGQPAPDVWDFMYYAFTIAMCFQTSDVAISNGAIRRLTLMHAIYSFFFVAVIFGFVVNVLSNLV